MDKFFTFEKIDKDNSVLLVEGFYIKLMTINGQKYTVIVAKGNEYLLSGDFSIEYQNIFNSFFEKPDEEKKIIPEKVPAGALLTAALDFYKSCEQFQIKEPITRLQAVTPNLITDGI